MDNRSNPATLGMFSRPALDLTTDEKHVFLTGWLEGDTGVRIPMNLQTAMQALKLLMVLREDKELLLPESEVDIDKVQ